MYASVPLSTDYVRSQPMALVFCLVLSSSLFRFKSCQLIASHAGHKSNRSSSSTPIRWFRET